MRAECRERQRNEKEKRSERIDYEMSDSLPGFSGLPQPGNDAREPLGPPLVGSRRVSVGMNELWFACQVAVQGLHAFSTVQGAGVCTKQNETVAEEQNMKPTLRRRKRMQTFFKRGESNTF